MRYTIEYDMNGKVVIREGIYLQGTKIYYEASGVQARYFSIQYSPIFTLYLIPPIVLHFTTFILKNNNFV